jgi:hypothetical protein
VLWREGQVFRDHLANGTRPIFDIQFPVEGVLHAARLRQQLEAAEAAAQAAQTAHDNAQVLHGSVTLLLCKACNTPCALQAAKQQAILLLTECAARLGDGQDLGVVNRMQEAAARTAETTHQEQAAEAEATATADRVQQLRNRLNEDANGDATVAASAVPSSATMSTANLTAVQIQTRAQVVERVYMQRFNNLTYDPFMSGKMQCGIHNNTM